jgi:hypothetical protein
MWPPDLISTENSLLIDIPIYDLAEGSLVLVKNSTITIPNSLQNGCWDCDTNPRN